MTRFTAAYSVDTDDEDEVLDAIDEIVDALAMTRFRCIL